MLYFNQLKTNYFIFFNSFFPLLFYCYILFHYFLFSLFVKQDSISRQVYTIYIYFAKNADEEISQKAIVGLGKYIGLGKYSI